ncbi:cytochrome b/b6 domain-containing protein [Halioxenophilus sp. WMMB6]|uniref:cytochrome b/b6 domain-containing protein n=1 Tax=Halioxenophilus sp. WMMB6 TaxID=3073815 RepID=UPI00295EFD58|nr:cytochrome b/b6 domain-containing protein [Halioxenophilus sp. WMMB6]
MEKDSTTRLKIWDLSLRLWHWAIVALMIFLWYSAEVADDLMEWHMLAGRLTLALILFRIVWGLVGSDTARFSHFLRGPKAVLQELRNLLPGGQLRSSIGHNPAGGWSVLVLLLIITAQGASGLFASDDYFYEGPWVSWASSDWQERLTDFHHLGFNLILAAVVIHLAAIVLHSLRGDHLVGAMITGRRKMPAERAQSSSLKWQSPFVGLVVLLISWLVVFASTSS